MPTAQALVSLPGLTSSGRFVRNPSTLSHKILKPPIARTFTGTTGLQRQIRENPINTVTQDAQAIGVDGACAAAKSIGALTNQSASAARRGSLDSLCLSLCFNHFSRVAELPEIYALLCRFSRQNLALVPIFEEPPFRSQKVASIPVELRR